MNSARSLGIAVGLTLLGGQVTSLGGQATSPQDLSRYRVYALESSLESIVAVTKSRAADVKTLHARPASIKELEWRAPYVVSGTALADPVREIVFTFYNDALYQLVVNYDRDRTEGLTNTDVVQSISAAYGEPALPAAGRRVSPPPEGFPDTVVVARWESAESLLTLVRGTHAGEYQLILASKALGTRAQSAIREAARLDTLEAPRREAAERKKEASDATAARDKIRLTNKAAFRH